jgi:hypothetical protein
MGEQLKTHISREASASPGGTYLQGFQGKATQRQGNGTAFLKAVGLVEHFPKGLEPLAVGA